MPVSLMISDISSVTDEAYITPIIVLHPFRRMMSSMIHDETNPATPIEIAEMTVNANGGLYDDSFAFMLTTIEAETDYEGRNCQMTEDLGLGAAEITHK